MVFDLAPHHPREKVENPELPVKIPYSVSKHNIILEKSSFVVCGLFRNTFTVAKKGFSKKAPPQFVDFDISPRHRFQNYRIRIHR
jgi:hypothetical protein